ncbi:MAG: PQQ-dependent sugar dehydrogenase, partial [Thaumarchaeota archaeon]
MDKERRLIVVAVAAVVIAAAATAFFTPSQTTLPIPEPRQNKGNSSSGIQVLAENLEVPWAIDVAQDGRLFFTERPGRIRVIENGTLLEEPAAYINVEQNGESGLLGLVLHP